MPDDWIRVRQIRAYGYHGVFPEERILGQIFEADVELCVDLAQAADSDNLAETINYIDIYRFVVDLLTGRPHILLESLAAHVADVLFQTYPVTRVIIRLRKPDIKISGQIGAIEVELQRERPEKNRNE